MKQIYKVLAVLTAMLVLLVGCGNKELTSAMVQDLLTNDYEIEYIFAMAGLPVNSQQPTKDEEQNLYFPVDSDKYKTLADLQKLLEATYIPEIAATILATADQNGAPLFIEQEGKLHRSAAPVINGRDTTLNGKSAKLQPAAKDDKGQSTVTFAVSELAEETEIGKVTMQAVEVKAGWRLAKSRLMASSDSPDTQAPPEGLPSFADTAQQFLDAMVAGDAATIKELATTTDVMGKWDWSQVSFDFLANAGVTESAILSTVSESELGGEYTVSITTDGSGRVFPKGTSSYRMGVSIRQGNEDMSVIGNSVYELWNEAAPPYHRLPYEEQDNPAIDQINRLIMLNGMIQFDSPAKLSDEVLTEYLLGELVVARPELSEVGYSLEDVQAMAVKLLGKQGFTPAKRFYSEETGSYLMWGRGGLFTNCTLSVIEEANGIVKVEAKIYADPLMLNHTSSIIYTMKNNWNGTFELVSGVLATE